MKTRIAALLAFVLLGVGVAGIYVAHAVVESRQFNVHIDETVTLEDGSVARLTGDLNLSVDVNVDDPPPPPPPQDTQPPTAPPNMAVSNVQQTSFTVSWGDSTDNVGVTNYRLFAEGVLQAEGENLRSFNATNLTCGTEYTYGVDAVDAAGNVSERSRVTETTAACSPPPPPPPGGVDCKISNRSTWTYDDCRYGTLVEVTNQEFNCRQSLASYGPLPLKVVVHATGTWNSASAFSAHAGCNGPAGDNVNLIVVIEGDGARGTVGNGQDSFKTRGFNSASPNGLVVTGRFDCGPIASGAHQDMIQFQGGSNLAFVNAVSGNYDAGRSTCGGAGGVIYSTTMPDVDFYGGSFIGCNHAILTGSSNHAGSSITDTRFRGGRVDGTDPNCVGFNSTAPCDINSSIAQTNVSCQRWVNGAWRDE